MTYKLVVAYEGTRYKGWQRLKTQSGTIQEKMERLLSKLLNEPIEVHGSGRTDAGVHAQGQVLSFKTKSSPDPEVLRADMNRYLPEDIVVTSAAYAHDSFHARLSAKKKVYTYRIWTSDVPPVFERHFVYDIEGRAYDLERMRIASRSLIEHMISRALLQIRQKNLLFEPSIQSSLQKRETYSSSSSWEMDFSIIWFEFSWALC